MERGLIRCELSIESVQRGAVCDGLRGRFLELGADLLHQLGLARGIDARSGIVADSRAPSGSSGLGRRSLAGRSRDLAGRSLSWRGLSALVRLCGEVF